MRTVQQDVFVLLPLLAVHTLVYAPLEDLGAWLNFVRVCRKRGHLQLSLKALMNLGVATSSAGQGVMCPRGRLPILRECRRPPHLSGRDGRAYLQNIFASFVGETHSGDNLDSPLQTGAALLPAVCMQPHGRGFRGLPIETHVHSRVAFAYVKHLWANGARQTALSRLRELAASLDAASSAPAVNALIPERHSAVRYAALYHTVTRDNSIRLARRKHCTGGSVMPARTSVLESELTNLLVHCYVKLGDWHLALHDDSASCKGTAIAEVQSSYQWATDLDPLSYKAWHAWALTNFQAVEHFQRENSQGPVSGRRHLCAEAEAHLVPAVHGFFRSIKLGQN